MHKYYKDLPSEHENKYNLKEKIQAKLDLRKDLLQDFFDNVFDTLHSVDSIDSIDSFKHMNCFQQKESEGDKEFKSYTFKEFTAKKGIEEVALMSTAGSGYKVSSDIDFDFQILPKELVNMPVVNRKTHITKAVNFVKKVNEVYKNMSNIAFAKCFDTNFYFSMYFWHPFDANLLQLNYYAQAIYYKIFLRYMILPENILINNPDLSEDEKKQKANENKDYIKTIQFEKDDKKDDIFADDKYAKYKDQIIEFYKNGETDFNPGDPKNEYNLYESYCNEFISYLTDLKSMSKENDNTELTKTVCRMLLLQPESYVFPYTTASVSLNLPEIENLSKQQVGVSPSSSGEPPPAEASPRLKGAVDKVVAFNRLAPVPKESYSSKFSNKHKNFLENINDTKKILIVEYLTIFENLSDLIFNLKGKYLLRAILNIVYTLYFINLNNKQILLDIVSFKFIENYLKNIKSGSLDKYINPIIIDYIYDCINNCTLEICSLSQLINIDQVKDINYDENKKMEYIKEVNNELKKSPAAAPAQAPTAASAEVAPTAAEVPASAPEASAASAAEQDGVSYKINKDDEINLRTKACQLHSKILEKLIHLDSNSGNNLNDTLIKIQQKLQEKLYAEMLTIEK